MSNQRNVSKQLSSLLSTSDIRLMTFSEEKKKAEYFDYLSEAYEWNISSIDWSKEESVQRLNLEDSDDSALKKFIQNSPIGSCKYVAVLPSNRHFPGLVASLEILISHFDLLVSVGDYTVIAGIDITKEGIVIKKNKFLEFKLSNGIWLTGKFN